MSEEVSGRWKVKRVSGLLPPFGVSKVIGLANGVTRLLGIPVAAFKVVGNEFRYRALPVRDRVHPNGDGTYEGEGFLFGKRFCRFRLEPIPS
ncbi:MAG: hypothetical protein ACJ790_20390 [Myxococcaceae bacterium]